MYGVIVCNNRVRSFHVTTIYKVECQLCPEHMYGIPSLSRMLGIEHKTVKACCHTSVEFEGILPPVHTGCDQVCWLVAFTTGGPRARAAHNRLYCLISSQPHHRDSPLPYLPTHFLQTAHIQGLGG